VCGVVADGHIRNSDVRVLSHGGVARVFNQGTALLCPILGVGHIESARGLGGGITDGPIPQSCKFIACLTFSYWCILT